VLCVLVFGVWWFGCSSVRVFVVTWCVVGCLFVRVLGKLVLLLVAVSGATYWSGSLYVVALLVMLESVVALVELVGWLVVVHVYSCFGYLATSMVVGFVVLLRLLARSVLALLVSNPICCVGLLFVERWGFVGSWVCSCGVCVLRFGIQINGRLGLVLR